MNDDRAPIEPNELDELLSAELDDELDEMARDRGVSAAELRDRLRAAPDVDRRRAALAAARDLLSQAPEIDELVAARLHAKAVRAADADGAERRDARTHRRARMFVAVGGIAAASVGVVALAAGLNGRQGASKSAGAARSADAPVASTSPSPALGYGANDHPAVAALGTFTDQHALALAAVGRAPVPNAPVAGYAGGESNTFGNASNSAVPQRAPTTSTPVLKGVASGAQSGQKRATAITGAAADSAAGTTCTARSPVAGANTEILRATAVLSGTPVFVFVFAGAREHVVVIEDLHCTLLNVQMLG